MLTFQSFILNFLALHITASFFKMPFLKGSPLKTPVSHNPFSMFQILISLWRSASLSHQEKNRDALLKSQGVFPEGQAEGKGEHHLHKLPCSSFYCVTQREKAVLPGISPLPVILDSSLWDRHVDTVNNITISCKQTQMTGQPLPPPSLLCVNKSYPGCLSNV